MNRPILRRMLLRLASIASAMIGKKTISALIVFCARLGQIDLLTHAYQRLGILNSSDNEASGERYLIEHVLKEKVSPSPFMFDIGANVGEYSLALHRQFPAARIFAFEPSPSAFAKLQENIEGTNIEAVPFGADSERGPGTMYTYAHDPASPHGSMHERVFTNMHGEQSTIRVDFTRETVDHFCSERSIGSIDFLKIDTEGNELSVLKGASRMLREGKIKLIQFEFNEMNVISRTFLLDFYDLLPGYEFYRLSRGKLIPLGDYNAKNEIFRFQNILAVNPSFHA